VLLKQDRINTAPNASKNYIKQDISLAAAGSQRERSDDRGAFGRPGFRGGQSRGFLKLRQILLRARHQVSAPTLQELAAIEIAQFLAPLLRGLVAVGRRPFDMNDTGGGETAGFSPQSQKFEAQTGVFIITGIP
jgi:hypothetical protein